HDPDHPKSTLAAWTPAVLLGLAAATIFSFIL
ncbi:MAG: hypothetical protein ACI9EF_001179, partial [Pseudohongiellaceae bacterium]